MPARVRAGDVHFNFDKRDGETARPSLVRRVPVVPGDPHTCPGPTGTHSYRSGTPGRPSTSHSPSPCFDPTPHTPTPTPFLRDDLLTSYKKNSNRRFAGSGTRYPSDSFAHKMVPQDFAILRVSQTTHLIPVFFLQSLTLVPFQRKLLWVSKMAKSDPNPGRTGTNGVHPGHRRVRWAPGAQGRASDPPGPRAHTCTDSPGP